LWAEARVRPVVNFHWAGIGCGADKILSYKNSVRLSAATRIVKLIVFMGAISSANPKLTVVQSMFYDVENRVSHVAEKAIVLARVMTLNLNTGNP
jgi:hypothetical protein